MKAICLILCAVHFVALAATPDVEVVDSIAIGGEARWDYLTVDSARQRLYVSHGTQTEVIDTSTDKLVGTISGTNGVHGIAIAGDLGIGFTSNGGDDSVTVFELGSLMPRSTIKVGANPDAIVYEAASQRVVTFNGKSHDATVIDAKRGRVLGTVPVGGKPEFAQAAADGIIYFNVEDTHELAALDPVAMKVTARSSLSPCTDPTGLAIDDARRLYSVCENKLMIISTFDGKRVAQMPIGSGPDGVVWLAGHAYSANGADGTLSVVGVTPAGGGESVATIPSAIGARTIAADPTTHRLYLPTADFKEGAPGPRRVGIPGTFRVLVLTVKQAPPP